MGILKIIGYKQFKKNYDTTFMGNILKIGKKNFTFLFFHKNF